MSKLRRHKPLKSLKISHYCTVLSLLNPCGIKLTLKCVILHFKFIFHGNVYKNYDSDKRNISEFRELSA